MPAGAGSKRATIRCRSWQRSALFLLGFVGLAISTLPYLVPPSLTIWDAAAHPSSQIFMLVGTPSCCR